MIIGHHSDIDATFSDISVPITVGNYTSIASHVQMHARIDHACITHKELVSAQQLPTYPPVTVRDHITIGSDVWIGRNAVLLGGITIGHGAIIGAFSVIARDIPPFAIAVGNPATILRYRFDPLTIDRLLELRWWDWPDNVVTARLNDLQNVNVLITKYF